MLSGCPHCSWHFIVLHSSLMRTFSVCHCISFQQSVWYGPRPLGTPARHLVTPLCFAMTSSAGNAPPWSLQTVWCAPDLGAWYLSCLGTVVMSPSSRPPRPAMLHGLKYGHQIWGLFLTMALPLQLHFFAKAWRWGRPMAEQALTYVYTQ